MKADKVYELETSADLCYTSFLDALRVLEIHHPHEKFEFYWYHLFVASQNFIVAHDVIGGRDRISIEIDFTYKPDEWSLGIVGFKKGKTIQVKVHTEGA